MNNRLYTIAGIVLITLSAGIHASPDDVGTLEAAAGSVPIPSADARMLEELIDDQGDVRFSISYPASGGRPAHRSSFIHVEDQSSVDTSACTIVTRVMRQRDSAPSASHRSVLRLTDVTRMQITTMAAVSYSSSGRQPAPGTPLNVVDPDIQVVALDLRGTADRGIFMFRSIEPARRFLAVLQRVVPRCGGRNE
ncbi:hypothetical protein G3O06_13795 [Burkholderia sp. Ac-20345]|uniref:hypothetical protein n=1 Tax=Burkholderia sp. Ac-20345 TaxID=2703891 RepID=UPI00197BCCE3|nr:hypothetical protein [Burkholderia sp. Ac-20345]MBN3778618.1 hypothetical protein [Burkholderia sp. Ac-20345]